MGAGFQRQYKVICQCVGLACVGVLRKVSVVQTAFSGQHLVPDAGGQQLAAAPVTVVVIVTFVVVSFAEAGAEIVIAAFPYQLVGIPLGNPVNTVPLTDRKGKISVNLGVLPLILDGGDGKCPVVADLIGAALMP